MLISFDQADLAEKNKKEIAEWEGRVKKVHAIPDKYSVKGSILPIAGTRDIY